MLRKILAVSCISILAIGPVQAQWLNLGPFELNSTLNLGLNYSTNADQLTDDERVFTPTGRELEKEDMWIDYGVTFNLAGNFFPGIDIDASTSLTFEKHFIRDDLDEDKDPFYDVTISASSDRGHWTYGIDIVYNEELTAEKEDVAISRDDLSELRRERDRTTTLSITPFISWTYQYLSADAGYDYEKETHNDEFSDADTETQKYDYSLKYTLNKRVSFTWMHEFEKEELIGAEGSLLDGIDTPASVAAAEAPVWEETKSIIATYQVLERPSLSVSGGYESEDEGEEKGEWDPTFSVDLSDTRKLAGNIDLTGTASYTWEKEEEVEDVAFTYSATLTHNLPSGWTQSLSAKREPQDTFGSTVDSTTTSYDYMLIQPNFIMRSLGFNFGLSHEIVSTPDAGIKSTSTGDEETTEWTVGLAKGYNLSKSLTANASYLYSLEQSNIESDITEHLYTLSFSYQL